jgi:nickel/cobalt exporter
MRPLSRAVGLMVLLAGSPSGSAHDIPNARVDRATQVTLSPGKLSIDYEVGLSELTLTQELRSLIGELPGADRREWFEAYGRETGPLNAKGFLVAVDGVPVDVRFTGFTLKVEEHPLFTFRAEAVLPSTGVLTVNDANFTSSQGTCRLAIRGRGVEILGDDLPGEVARIPARPTWQLSDEEETRAHYVRVEFRPASTVKIEPVEPVSSTRRASQSPDGLSRLLDREQGVSLAVLLLIAFGLGAAHALQPGHGKALVASSALSERGAWWPGAVVAVVATLTHTGSVFLIALALWCTRTSRFGEIHVALMRTAGFVIAAVGVWRLGRVLGGSSIHDRDHASQAAGRPSRDLVGIGIAGGLVPCWDAVGLVVLAQAVSRLRLGLMLVAAFSLGMGLVLVGVSWMAARLRALLERFESTRWDRSLGLVTSVVLTSIGIYLLSR